MKQPHYQRAWNILKPNKHQPKKKRKLQPNEVVSLVAELVGCFQREVLSQQKRHRPPTRLRTSRGGHVLMGLHLSMQTWRFLILHGTETKAWSPTIS
ncbi:hypothetical protein GBA52_009415 [Prunus armeniaca]|nr:hypothetical protein GBA52_009415 [Prunus armeniaca]